MDGMDWAYVALAINPFGGLLIAVPFAVFQLDYSPWLILVSGPPLAYVQVVVTDLAGGILERWPWWKRMLEGKRSPRITRLLEGKGAFWSTFLAAPLVGPWVVMAFMRYAGVPQRRIALPILLSMLMITLLATAGCYLVPQWLGDVQK